MILFQSVKATFTFSLTAATLICPISAWVPSFSTHQRMSLASTTDATENAINSTTATQEQQQTSTLRLLEHVNLNIPSHQSLPFYFTLLGCGLDPRKAENLKPDAAKKTIWANMGASQFHLPYGETPQVIPGEIGLCYESMDAFKNRLNSFMESPDKDCVSNVEYIGDNSAIKITDQYGNVYVCRERPTKVSMAWKQPVITQSQQDQWQDIAAKYGLQTEQTDCHGIDYVEFACPLGSAEKIAQFYQHVFDAPTSVVAGEDATKIAVIGIGKINSETRQADQNLLFREIPVADYESIKPYDGHHVALYVGDTMADFEQAFKNAQTAGVVWVNPRFSDKATTIQGAKNYNQFRFKDIIDLETGKTIFTLEHEMRSPRHSAWPGK